MNVRLPNVKIIIHGTQARIWVNDFELPYTTFIGIEKHAKDVSTVNIHLLAETIEIEAVDVAAKLDITEI